MWYLERYLERCCLVLRGAGTFLSSAGGRALVQLPTVLEASTMILFLICV